MSRQITIAPQDMSQIFTEYLKDQSILFVFSTDDSDAVYNLGGVSPGETYTGKTFGLVRNSFGKWEVKNNGWYGS